MKIYNLSISNSDIDDKEFEKLLESNVVSVLNDIKTNGKNSQCSLFINAKKGDVFYLNRSDSVELIGMFVDERPLRSIIPKNSNWIDRSFKVLSKAISPKSFSSTLNKTWSPKNSSKFVIIPNNDFSELENSILQPVFDCSLTDIESLHKAELKGNELSVDDCFKLQKKFKKLKNDEDYLLRQVNSIDYIELLKIVYGYKERGDTSKQPVVNLRFQLLMKLLKKEQLSIDIIDKLKSDISSQSSKNVFKAWKDPFRILYSFLYEEYKSNVIDCFVQLIEKLQTNLQLLSSTKFKLVHLDGAQNQGNTEIWFAIYNKCHSSQQVAKQLFFKIEDEFVYGVHYKADSNVDNLHSASEFDYEHLLNKFNKHKDIILNDNHALKVTEKKIMKIKSSLNQILFGPPGTGKTYNSIIKAVEIIKPGYDTEQKFDVIKDDFDKFVANKQIMFTTFHQSMSYEDFIEGIKPDLTGSDSSISYHIKDGIFKKICKLASPEFGNFDSVIESFKQEVSEADGKSPLTIKAKGTIFDVIYRGTAVFYVQPHASSKEKPWYPVNIDNISKTFSTGSTEGVYNPTYVREIINYLVENNGLKQVADNSNKNYVLIIDEINRGNVSSIFGELITLIENNKRQNSKEALEIILPYSKEKFSVPNNLYIIGTMNTADRSVEALDSALRRRFSFTEMPPNPSLIETEGNKIRYIDPDGENIDLVNLLKVINERLEILLDNDHLIGHSYFMKVTDLASLHNAFYNEIIPLLQEYFFGDYGKISMVLGEGFCGLKKYEKKVEFAKVPQAYDKPDYDDKLVFEVKKVKDEEFMKAIDTLLL